MPFFICKSGLIIDNFQVCQDIPAYTESNLFNNKLSLNNDHTEKRWLEVNEYSDNIFT